jgi:hypothetical protein
MGSVKWKVNVDEFVPASHAEEATSLSSQIDSEKRVEGMLKNLSLSTLEADSWESGAKENPGDVAGKTEVVGEDFSAEDSEPSPNEPQTREGKEHLNIVFIGHVGRYHVFRNSEK